jgi:hypothetical protein
LGAYRIPLETGLLIPSDKSGFRKLAQTFSVLPREGFPSFLNIAGINASPITNVATKNPVSN